ncbi:MAG: hypothetical protein ACI8W3_002385 [Myxococcota bacterium]|jgi:hypothetical protein
MTQLVSPQAPIVRCNADPYANILDDSYTGFSIRLQKSDTDGLPAAVACKMGNLDPLPAEVVWSRPGSDSTSMLGFTTSSSATQ